MAVATPPGRGGIGVVRLAGPAAAAIAQSLVARDTPFEPRHATFARVIESEAPDPRAVDQVVVTWFQAPHSYTGDDVVELSAHGSPVLLQRVVELAMRHGARLAEPGEFTLRAYLNGRLDLIQAEAVADLIEAVTPLQARAAMDQLEGTLTEAIGRIDAELFDLAARLEASLDFPDEGFHFVTREEAVTAVRHVADALRRLSAEGDVGRVIREGRVVAIVGRPNAGKSSLFNALLGTARAIVTDIPGTTRDLLSETVDVGGVPVTLVDTAGLRPTGDPIEVEGVARARQAQRVAALTLCVIDRSTALTEADRMLLREAGRSIVVVTSKADLPAAWPEHELAVDCARVAVSAVTGEGLAALRAKIAAALIEQDHLRDVPALSNVRHLSLVREALASVDDAAAALERGATEELVLVGLTAARHALEQITGRRAPDDLLRHIFARFCVGK